MSCNHYRCRSCKYSETTLTSHVSKGRLAFHLSLASRVSSSLLQDGFEHLQLLVAVRERLRALPEQLHHLLVRRGGVAQPVDDVVDLRGEALERLH